MNRSPSDGRSRRISSTSRRTSAAILRALTRVDPRPSPREAKERLLEVGRAGAFAELRAGPARDNASRTDEQQLVAAVGFIHDVARYDDRRAAIRERSEVAPELDPEEGVDADGRFVEEQDRRVVDEGAGEREAPPLATRERARE